MNKARDPRSARVVRVESTFDAPPERVWELVQSYGTFRWIMRGLLGFTGVMPARITPGDSLRLRLWFFHVLPGWTHHLSIAEVDQEKRVIQSRETGGLVRRWDHKIIVLPTDGSARTRYVDEIEIEAGAFTPLVCFWAHVQYRYRQARWKALLRKRHPNWGAS